MEGGLRPGGQKAYGGGMDVNIVWVERYHWNIWYRCMCVRGLIEVDEGRES